MVKSFLLFGAGASIEYGALSTSDLTTRIESRIREDPVMQMEQGNAAYLKILAALTEYLSGPVNFEQIYHCVHELAFHEPSANAKDEFRRCSSHS